MAMSQTRPDEAARREYWRTSLENAWEFMQQLYRLPLEESSEEMVSLEAAAHDARLEVTFSSRPHAEGSRRIFFLRRGLIEGFLGVAAEMNRRGWVLHVEDAFRTPAMQRGLWLAKSTFDTVLAKTRWELGGAAPDEALLQRRLSAVVAACPRIGGHLSGAAVDVSVFRRAGRAELDRGRPYIELSELTPMNCPFLTPEQAANRKAITEVFERLGFAAYPWEFWHYSRGDLQEAALHRTGKPARYGPVSFDPATGRVKPVENALEPFVPLAEIRRKIAEAMAA